MTFLSWSSEEGIKKASAIPAVPHLAQLQSPICQWVLTGLPGSTLLALGVLQEGPTFTALSVFLSRGTEGSNPASSSRESGEIVGSATLAGRGRCFTVATPPKQEFA